MTRSNRLLVASVAAVLAILAAAVLAYAIFLRGDNVAPLALGSPSPSAAATVAPGATPTDAASGEPTTDPGTGIATLEALAGDWTVGTGSIVGYRVREKLADLPAESDAVGRTESVTGSISVSVDGGAVRVAAGSFEADLTTLTSDNGRRDNRIRSSGLESNTFPTATFVLLEPVAVTGDILGGATLEATLVGDLTLHGESRRVSIPAQARLTGSTIEVVGALIFPFADFGMTPPNIGGFVSVDDNASLEFSLILTKG